MVSGTQTYIPTEHEKWFAVMAKQIFGTASTMRSVLTLKKTVYNSWAEYGELMNLPFSRSIHPNWLIVFPSSS